MNRRNALKTLGVGAVAAILPSDVATADVVSDGDILVLSVRQGVKCPPAEIAKLVTDGIPKLKGRVLVVDGCDVNVIRGKE